MNVFVTALLLILPISALAARRLPLSSIVKLALLWVAIFTALVLVVMLWQRGMDSV